MTVVNIRQRRISALINSDTEVTVITSNLVNDLKLLILKDFNINILTATEKLKKFISLYKDILITVKKIIHKMSV